MAEVEGLLGAGEGGGLEASMHSSFLQEGFRTEEAQQNPTVPGSSWDTSAVVGRLFQVKLPQQVDDVVKVSSPVLLRARCYVMACTAPWLMSAPGGGRCPPAIPHQAPPPRPLPSCPPSSCHSYPIRR